MNESQYSFAFLPEIREPICARALARSADPVPSHEAAERMEKCGVAEARRRVLLSYIRNQPGLSSKQYAALSGIDRVEAARRIADMKNGLVKQDGRAPDGDTAWWPL